MASRGRVFAAAVAAFAASACSDGPAAPAELADYGSGSRLRANVYRLTDGTTWLIDFYDTALDVGCKFHETPLGQRCLPVGELDTEFGYSDEACTRPVARSLGVECLPEPELVLEREQSCTLDGESPVNKVHRLGARHDGVPFYQLQRDGSCAGGAKTSWHELEEVPLTTFVGATVRPEEGGDTLTALRLVADDGAHLVSGLFDRERGVACRFASETGPRNDGRCVPSSALRLSSGFHLGSCDGPALFVGRLDCEAPPEVVLDVAPACNQLLALRDAGETRPADDAFVASPDACFEAASAFTFGVSAVELGDELDPADFPLISPTPRGSGRLTTRVATGGGKDLAASLATNDDVTREAWFFDNELGMPCFPLRDSEGRVRCVSGPMLSGADDMFGDADCTMPLVRVATCGVDRPSIGFRADCFAGPVTSAFDIGGPAAQAWALDSAGVCSLVPLPASAFLVTGEREVDVFAELEEITE